MKLLWHTTIPLSLAVLHFGQPCWSHGLHAERRLENEFINDRKHQSSRVFQTRCQRPVFLSVCMMLACINCVGWAAFDSHLPANFTRFGFGPKGRTRPRMAGLRSNMIRSRISHMHLFGLLMTCDATCSSKTHRPCLAASRSIAGEQEDQVGSSEFDDSEAPEGWDFKIHESVWERQRPSWHWKSYEQVEVEAPSESLKRFRS